MHLPINISQLLQGNIVENDRLEFKAGWNPEKVLKTICAFANDFNNYGGGYIVIGIEEQDGVPMFPPKGVSKTDADKIQKELVRICAFLKPVYTPIISIESYQSKIIVIIWAPGGQTRPYAAPESLGKDKQYKYYIRKLSSTVEVKNDELKELLSLTATVPFDDRLNHQASLQDLKLPLIQSFLHEVESKLLEDSRNMTLPDLCRQMLIVEGGNEYLKPRNVGLLFFNDQPEKFFPYVQIDVVYFPDDEGGDIIQEEIFKGPLDHQLRSALRYIQNNFITERIIKHPDRAEATHIFNYPYIAIEEALVNAVYHRSYEIREPIEVRINRQSITVVSHPGADPSIPSEDIKRGRMVSRRYRNRRIGELLKELDFTEGRGTGVPKMRRALANNGSPEAVFFSDESRLSFWTEIQIHPEFLKDLESPEAHDEAKERVVALAEAERQILKLALNKPIKGAEILEVFGYKVFPGNIRNALNSLLQKGLIAYTIPEKPRSKNQQYHVTEKGRSALREEPSKHQY